MSRYMQRDTCTTLLIQGSREPSCQSELLQVYCAYRLNPSGLCLPPFALAPRQSTEADPADLQPSFQQYPPLLDRYEFLEESERRPLTRPGVPDDLRMVRLAFFILVHKDAEALLQQLQLLYSPRHEYMYHVDKRQHKLRLQLTLLIAQSFPHASNIRMLPEEESFIPSWGSYGIVRAELQGYRALLRLPGWEYLVKLSGADLPLRSVEDLSFALAPLRPRSLVSTFRERHDEGPHSLLRDVWHGCGGHVYNVTRGAGPPPLRELTMLTGSQWSAPHRSLLEYMLWRGRSGALRRYHFYLSTAVIPDEMFTATVVRHSPYRNSTLSVSLHWLKQFQKQTALNLCRHTQDADFCGQGPSIIEPADLPQLSHAAHRHFFARKFPTTAPDADVRRAVAQHLTEGYYGALLRHLSQRAARQLVLMSLRELKRRQLVQGGLLWDGSTSCKLRMVPQLDSPHPCCSLAHQLGYKMVQSYAAILDFTIFDEKDRVLRFRSRVLPQRVFACFPDGHLRALRLSTWDYRGLESRSNSKDEPTPGKLPPQLSVNLPLSTSPAPVNAVYVELWLHVSTRSVNTQCQREPTPEGIPMHFPRLNTTAMTADPLSYAVWVIDAFNKTRCGATQTAVWSARTVRPNADNELAEMPSLLTVRCQPPLLAGLYRLAVRQNIRNARIYEMPFVVLPRPDEDPLLQEPNGSEEGRVRVSRCGNCFQLPPVSPELEIAESHDDVFFGTWPVASVAVLPSGPPRPRQSLEEDLPDNNHWDDEL